MYILFKKNTAIMKKIFFAIAILSTIFIISSCSKENDNDPLVAAGPDVTHPDSTVIEVKINAGLTAATQLRMVGDMKAPGTIWTPGDNNSSLVLDKVNDSTFSKQVINSWFVKSDFEFKFLRANNWGGGNEEIVPVSQQVGGGNTNRKASKGALKGKVIRLRIEKWN
jgi:hypothetical protein